MFKTKTLDDITYHDKWYRIGSDIIVEDKDIEKLVKLGAIAGGGAGIPDKVPKVKIKVIKNPIKPQIEVDKMFDNLKEEIPADEKLSKVETKEFIAKEILPKIKRKDRRKGKSFKKRRR